jgi:multiphosphoryl transfer protein
MIRLRGAGGTPGVAHGPIVRFEPTIATKLPPFAILRDQAIAYFGQLASQLRGSGMPAEAAIFDAQALLVADPALEAAVHGYVERGASVSDAIKQAVEDLASTLDALPDAYLRGRAADIRGVGTTLLAGGHAEPVALTHGAILVASELTPAHTLNLPLDAIGGFATASGTATSHAAILARSLGIPAVLGLGTAVLDVAEGTIAVLDGDSRTLILDPDQPTRSRYAQLHARAEVAARQRLLERDLAADTKDGRHITLWANIGGPDDVGAALAAGAEGIGLFRTEFVFLSRPHPPSEDEQFARYIAVLEQMGTRPVVTRMLDVGGDKPLPYLPGRAEPNPFLGERGIRFLRRFPDLFRVQLRALLRAASHGDMRVMVPMVSTLGDVLWARKEFAAAHHALAAEGVTHRADVPFGIMIETPAAALMSDQLAQYADFFSVGSNDLSQYTLAADRTLAELAGRYDSHDPAVFRLIRQAVNSARAANIGVSVCGELAGDPEAVVALIGLGIEHLSMAPSMIGIVKSRIRSTTLAEAAAISQRACGDI